MLHGLGDCASERHCGCLDGAVTSSRDVVRAAVQSALEKSAGRRTRLVMAALDPVLSPLEHLADLVRREHVPATTSLVEESGAVREVAYCAGCGVLLAEEPCPYLETLAGRVP